MSIILATVYRPGSEPSADAFFKEFFYLEFLSIFKSQVTLTGDINIRLDRDDDRHCERFNNTLTGFNLTKFVSQSTHQLGGTLDVIVTDSSHPPSCVDVVDVGVSDHMLVT